MVGGLSRHLRLLPVEVGVKGKGRTRPLGHKRVLLLTVQ
jgi:hypothetical protein